MALDPIKGLDFATDLAKQIITVATGTLALTVTFAEKFDPDGAPPVAVPLSMPLAWLFYVLAITGAVWFLMAAAGSANRIAKGEPGYGDIMNPNTRLPAILMVVAFFVALVATAWTGWCLVA